MTHVAAIPNLFMSRRLLCCITALLLITGCDAEEETRPIGPEKPFGTVVVDTAAETAQGAAGMVEEPFKDVGLSRESIPQILQGLDKNPYIMPGAPLCENLSIEIMELTKVLGMDMGSAGMDRKTSYTEEGIEAAQGKASDLMHGEVQVIPFRGVVRRISGAEKHARKVAAAYEAGKLRRAYLKGLRQAYQCP